MEATDCIRLYATRTSFSAGSMTYSSYMCKFVIFSNLLSLHL
jgi:hypothetical protein